jgi:molecular chaperone GrpE
MEKGTKTKKKKTRKELEEQLNRYAARVEELEARVAELEQERKQQEDRYLRLLADFDNYRKAQEQRWKQMVGVATENLMMALIPVLDAFEEARRAMQKATDTDALRKGVEMIHRRMLGVLTREGLEMLGEEGEPFDPSRHEVLEVVNREDLPENTVARVLQRGYRLNGKLLRPARVQVTRATGTTETDKKEG